ncbi:MAG: polymorphic toxin-type HINT domain-containing protein [Myxococcota bacterium]
MNEKSLHLFLDWDQRRALSIRDTVPDWRANSQLVESIVHTVSVFDSEQTLALTLSSGEVLSVTPSHPFYSTTRGWVDAVELYPGDQLATADVPVQVVSVAWNRQPTQVVHIEVDGEHTYFAGESGLLTHNKWLVDRLKGLLGKKPSTVVDFEILDGVRRSKAVDEAAKLGIGDGKIRANVIEQGRNTGQIRIEAGELLSPKDSIDTSGSGLSRWHEILKQTVGGSPPPPIDVTPGTKGVRIREVPIEVGADMILREYQALAAINAVLVQLRRLAHNGRPYEELVKALDLAEYLPRLLAHPENRTDEFQAVLTDLVGIDPFFRIALDRFNTKDLEW